MRKLCLYHKSDLDGQCSGAIYRKAHPDGQLIGIDYGDEIPWKQIEGAALTVIDWSFQPWENFCRAMRTARSILWIDHHKSAILEWVERNELRVLGYCPVTPVLSVKYAGCELAWMRFFPKIPIPFGVRMLGRYDVWDHSDPEVLPYQYGMRILDTEPSSVVWIPVLTTTRAYFWHEERIAIGRSLLKYQEQNDAAAVQKAWFPVTFANKRWQACNRLGKGSRFFASVWNPDEFDGMLSFGWDGRQWKIGLYSDKPTMDCGAIASARGGGGHPGAAGFLCDKLPFPIVAETAGGDS